jgi:hypothetical protein
MPDTVQEEAVTPAREPPSYNGLNMTAIVATTVSVRLQN